MVGHPRYFDRVSLANYLRRNGYRCGVTSQPDPPFQMPKSPWILRPFERIADSNIAAQKSSVKNPRRYYRVQRWVLLRYFIVLGFALAISFSTHIPWWGMLAWVVTVYFASIGASSNATAARRYLSGWLDGRSAMISALKEATDRGLDLHEWVRGEHERDTMVLMNAYGIEVDTPVPDDD